MDVCEESPESSRFAEDIVETIREPLLVLDKNRRVLSANPAFYRTFHVDPRETQGVLVYELGNGQWDIPRLRQLLEEILPESTTIEDFVVDHEFHEIGHRTMVLNARRLDDSNKILLAIEDITERKRDEEELQRVNAELEGFASSVSHDLRGPLAAIGLAGKLAADSAGKGIVDREEMLEFSGTIERNLDKSFALIDDLLAFAKVGQPPGSIEIVDLDDTVECIREEQAVLIQERGARVIVEGRLGTASMNSTHAYQVFSNLIGNAIVHNNSPDPRLTVRRALEPVGESRNRFVVCDNGQGIPEDINERIFELFVKGPGGGTGMGLAIVSKIVGLYGGEITVRSDDGACFEFTLPSQER